MTMTAPEAPIPGEKIAGILPHFSDYFKDELWTLAFEEVRYKGPIEVYELISELSSCADIINDGGAEYVVSPDEWDCAELFSLMEDEGAITITVAEDGGTWVDTPYAPSEPAPVQMAPLRVVELFAGIG